MKITRHTAKDMRQALKLVRLDVHSVGDRFERNRTNLPRAQR